MPRRRGGCFSQPARARARGRRRGALARRRGRWPRDRRAGPPLLLALLPALGVLYALSGYRDTYVDVVLPEAAGIAAGGLWPAGALSLVAAALAVRGLEGERRAAVAAGAVAGLAALAHPSGVLVLVGIALALAVAWRPAEAALVALGALPGVVVAAVAYGFALDVSWAAFTAHMTGLREYLWSNRVLQWLPLAGVIGAARGSLTVGVLLAGWFGAFASSTAPRRTSAGRRLVLRRLCPGAAGVRVLVASLPLLVPSLPRRLERPWTLARSAFDPLLQQRQPLGQDHVLVGELRDHRRVVQQHEQDEEDPDREQDCRRIAGRRRPSRRSCRAPRATPRGRAARCRSRARAARSALAAGGCGSARARRGSAGSRRSSATIEMRSGVIGSSIGTTRRRKMPTKSASVP